MLNCLFILHDKPGGLIDLNKSWLVKDNSCIMLQLWKIPKVFCCIDETENTKTRIAIINLNVSSSWESFTIRALIKSSGKDLFPNTAIRHKQPEDVTPKHCTTL